MRTKLKLKDITVKVTDFVSNNDKTKNQKPKSWLKNCQKAKKKYNKRTKTNKNNKKRLKYPTSSSNGNYKHTIGNVTTFSNYSKEDKSFATEWLAKIIK